MRSGFDSVPFWGLLMMGVVGLALTALMIAALVQIAQRPGMDSTTRAMWILIVLVAPVLGAIAWFWIRPKGLGSSSPPSR